MCTQMKSSATAGGSDGGTDTGTALDTTGHDLPHKHIHIHTGGPFIGHASRERERARGSGRGAPDGQEGRHEEGDALHAIQKE